VTDQGGRNVFRFTNRDDETGAAIARHLYHVRDKRRAVVVETATMYGRSMAYQFMRAFAELGGEIVSHCTVHEGDREFGPLIRSLPTEFDLLFYGGSFEGALILRAMRAAGLRQLFAAGDGCWDLSNFLEPAGNASTAGEGVLVLSATPEVGRVPGSQGFAERYRRRYGPIGNYAVNSYDSMRLLLCAIEGVAGAIAGIPTRQQVVAAVRDISFEGIAYPDLVEWDDKGDNRAALTALNTVERGRFREVAEIWRRA
jgi:branched-chain amino acid transport system substrate-binding protein